jgi:hypothetical protein
MGKPSVFFCFMTRLPLKPERFTGLTDRLAVQTGCITVFYLEFEFFHFFRYPVKPDRLTGTGLQWFGPTGWGKNPSPASYSALRGLDVEMCKATDWMPATAVSLAACSFGWLLVAGADLF